MVTNEQIEAFKQGALARKDQAQINLCRAALAGDASARDEVGRLMAQPQPRRTEQDPGPFGNGEQVDPTPGARPAAPIPNPTPGQSTVVSDGGTPHVEHSRVARETGVRNQPHK